MFRRYLSPGDGIIFVYLPCYKCGNAEKSTECKDDVSQPLSCACAMVLKCGQCAAVAGLGPDLCL